MEPLRRREFLGTVVLTGLTARLAGAAGAGERKPNIVYIMADDLGYGDLGCYGQKLIRTPNIDRLASQGTRFTDCYSGSTVCAPSRCSLMTGLHTGHCHIRGNALVPLRPEDRTVAEVLKAGGYATGIIGKWGLGEPDTDGVPNRKGFDEWYGYLNQVHAHNYYPDYLWENEMRAPLDGKTYTHDLFTARALDFLARHKDHPFFLCLTYTVPHANNEKGAATGNGMEVPAFDPYADESWPDPEKGRAAMITRLDTDVGRLMEKLSELGLENDTVVFFTSDNGPHREGGSSAAFFQSSGPLRGIKRDLYDGGIRVPMLVRWPGQVKAGETSGQVWAFWDFLPTAAEIAGAQAPDGIDGLSMLPALLGRPQKGHEYLYWEFHENGFKQAIRTGKWKVVKLAPSTPAEVYDIEADPSESKDVSGDNPELVANAETWFKEARTDSKEFPVTVTAKPPA
jgi:arylsulfatase A-like enzyme